MNARRALRMLFSRADVERELDDELQAHLEFEARALVERGLPPDEARRQAAIALGGLQKTKEEVIDAGLPRWLEAIRRDARIAIRALRHQRVFAISAVLALSLAIAVNTTMFSVIDAMMNPAIGAKEPERLFELKYFGDPRRRVDFTERERAIASTVNMHGGYTEWTFGNVHSIEHGNHVDGERVAKVRPNLFTVLGTTPLEGSVTPPSGEGSAPAVVISDRLRALLFHPGESPVGKTILLDGNGYLVIGVVARFDGLEPLAYDAWYFSRPGETLLFKLIRLKDDETLEQAQKHLDVVAAQLALAAGDDRKDTRFYLRPVRLQFHAGQFHYALIGAGIAILLVACTNLANLQLARGLSRSTELAVRSSLGASRRQIVTQLLVESGVLACVALVVALALTLLGNALITAFVPPRFGEYVVQPQASWRMVVVAAVAAVVGLVAMGLLPALRVSRVDLNTLLKGRAGTGAHRSNRSIYGVLVVAQIGLTLPLVCAAVLLSVSAKHTGDAEYLIRNEVGFDPRPLVQVNVQLPRDSARRKVSLAEKAAELVARAHAIDGVTAAAVVGSGSYADGKLTIMQDGAPREFQAPTPPAGYWVVTPEFNAVYGYGPMMRGMTIAAGARGASPVVIDEHTAKVLWPRESPIGKTILLGAARSAAPPQVVVGILGTNLSDEARAYRDLLFSPSSIGIVMRLIDASDSIAYSPWQRTVKLMVRASGDPAPVAERLRRGFTDDPRLPPSVMLMVDYYGFPQRAAATRFVAGLFSVFALIALGLSTLGVYAIVAQSVTDRKREVAVRISVGATTRNIVYVLIREGNVLVLAGTAIGLFFVWKTTGWVGTFLSGVDAQNPFSIAALCALLFLIMVMSAVVPALRAARMDPMEALRAE